MEKGRQRGGGGKHEFELVGYTAALITSVVTVPETGRIFVVGVCRKHFEHRIGEPEEIVYHSFIASFDRYGRRSEHFGSDHPKQNIHDIDGSHIDDRLARNRPGIIIIRTPSILRSIKVHGKHIFVGGTQIWTRPNRIHYGALSEPSFSNKKQFLLMKFDFNGNLDPSFGQEGAITSYFPYGGEIIDIEVQNDGKVVVGGNIGLKEVTIPGRRTQRSFTFIVGRYSAKGLLDSSFGDMPLFEYNRGFTRIDFPNPAFVPRAGLSGITIDGYGKIVAVGYVWIGVDGGRKFSTKQVAGVVRLTTQGYNDFSFGDQGVVLSDFLPSSYPKKTFDVDGYVVGTNATDVLIRDNKIITSVLITGNLIETKKLQKVDQGADHKTVFGKSFSAIVRYNFDGTLDRSWNRDKDGLDYKYGIAEYSYKDHPVAAPGFRAIGMKINHIIAVGMRHTFQVYREFTSQGAHQYSYDIQGFKLFEAPFYTSYTHWNWNNRNFSLEAEYGRDHTMLNTLTGGQGTFTSIHVNHKNGTFIIGGGQKQAKLGKPNSTLRKAPVCKKHGNVLPCPQAYLKPLF